MMTMNDTAQYLGSGHKLSLKKKIKRSNLMRGKEIRRRRFRA